MRGLRDRLNAHQGEKHEPICLVEISVVREHLDLQYRTKVLQCRLLVARCWLIFGLEQ